MLALPGAPVLGECLGKRQARRREGRSVVEEPRQERAAGVVGHEARGYTGRRARPRAVGACEPRQIREEAALSSYSQVCDRSGPLLESTRGCALPEVPSAELRGGRRAGGGRPDADE